MTRNGCAAESNILFMLNLQVVRYKDRNLGQKSMDERDAVFISSCEALTCPVCDRRKTATRREKQLAEPYGWGNGRQSTLRSDGTASSVLVKHFI